MIIIIISVIVLILCLNSSSYLSLLSSAQKISAEDSIVKNKVEPELIWEKQFEEPVIDTIFGEAEMTVKEARVLGVKGLEKRSPTEKIKIKYPKVFFIGDPKSKNKKSVKTIKFFNIRGELKNKIELKYTQPPIYSPNKKIVGVVHVWTLTTYDLNGKKKSQFGIGEFGNFKLADDGSLIVYWSSILFFNPQGELIKKIPELYLFHFGSLTPDSKYFLIIIMGKFLNHKSFQYPSTDLFCYDLKGNLIWKYNIAEMNSRGIRFDDSLFNKKPIEITKDSKKITITGYQVLKPSKKQWIFDISGKLIETTEGW